MSKTWVCPQIITIPGWNCVLYRELQCTPSVVKEHKQCAVGVQKKTVPENKKCYEFGGNPEAVLIFPPKLKKSTFKTRIFLKKKSSFVFNKVFKDHAIDGETLPLLTEEHLRSTMGLKLGPALKIQSQVG